MQFRRARGFVCLVLLLAGHRALAQDRPPNFLFYGNSFTNYWNVPQLVGDIAVAAGNPPPNIENASVDGQSLGYHLANNTAVITSPHIPTGPGFHWDVLVLQEYSTMPTHIGNPSQFRSDASSLLGLVRQNSPGVMPVLYETWARAPGNTGFYPSLFPNAAAMQQELRDNYQLARQTLDAAAGAGRTQVAPVGDAFQLGNWSGIYADDLYHANSSGALLAALTIYGTIYRDTVSDLQLGSIQTNLQKTATEMQRLKSLSEQTIAAALAPSASMPQNATRWNADANGSWSVGSNWIGGVPPNGIGAAASFGTIITQRRTVNVDTNRSLNAMSFDSPFGYALVGAGSITLDAGASPALVRVDSGTHSIANPIRANSDLLVSTNSATSGLSVAGSLDAGTNALIKTGSGTLQLGGIHSGAVRIAGGMVRLSPGAGGEASVINNLHIVGGASLDLTNTSLILDSPTPTSLLLSSTRRNLWNSRLVSSSVNGTSTRLGYADSTTLDLPDIVGQTNPQYVLVQSALTGDTNLDGQVDITDLMSLATHWRSQSFWTGGDFNYDGTVDATDLGMLAANWQAGVGASASVADAVNLSEALASLRLPVDAAVPEPAMLSMLILSAAILRRCRVIKGVGSL